MAWLSATFGSLMLEEWGRRRMKELWLPWAKLCSDRLNVNVMTIYWEDELESDLKELRNRLGVVMAPKIGFRSSNH